MGQIIEKKLQNLWLKLFNDLKGLFKLIAPRYLFYSVQENVLHIKLHGFCGVQWRFIQPYSAYSAYICVLTKNGIFVNLLCGKAKVAPKISILRVELLKKL